MCDLSLSLILPCLDRSTLLPFLPFSFSLNDTLPDRLNSTVTVSMPAHPCPQVIVEQLALLPLGFLPAELH